VAKKLTPPYGTLIEPTTLKIERLLPGPIEASGRISPTASCVARGLRRAR
jgi:hypothetical protein